MKYYLCLDSGGTKLAAVLYDENFRRRGVCVVGSVRPNTTGAELIKKHTDELIETLGIAGKTIEEYAGTCEKSVIGAIENVCTVKGRGIFGELDMGLSAAGVFGDGILALCGTGATVFARVGERKFAAGGYGAAVADEGSGYYIGRQALIAAIRDSEGRGEHTALTKLLPEYLGGAGDLRTAIFSIYGKTDISPAASVARCAPAVIAAAEQNDAVATEILIEAGRLLGEQTCYLIRENDLSDDLPIALSGSMWRKNPVLLNEFRRVIAEQSKERKIMIPRIEPILGAVAYNIYKSKNALTDGDITRLISEFPEFEYDINENKAPTRR